MLQVVKKFLGVPDSTKPNPRDRSTVPIQCDALARVEVYVQEDGRKQMAGVVLTMS